MSVVDLTSPHFVMARLADIEHDLAMRQPGYELAAQRWFTAKREVERQRAIALLKSDHGSVTEKRAQGDLAAHGVEGSECEAEYEATRAVLKVLETRAMIAMAILKSQGRIT